MTQIDVARDFSRFPAGRYISDGRYSGERFRRDFLEPALRAGSQIAIKLDGVMGYGSSFLEEAFGGLIRDGFEPNLLQSRMSFLSEDSSLTTEIKGYIGSANR